MERINELADEARESISDFCINECNAYCCREGYLIISRKEVELIVGENENLLIETGKLKEMLNGKYSLEFKNSLGGCPMLKDLKCIIHKNELRPNTCKDFPIFILGKKIRISNRCPAKKENRFFKFEKEAISLGYEIVDELF